MPYEKYSIQTSRCKNEILQILSWNTEPGRLFPISLFKCYKKRFIGIVGEDSFKIVLADSFYGSFVPFIEG
ncbi:MAG: hypothetical protein AAGU32_18095, partial [Bacillota bacterium]